MPHAIFHYIREETDEGNTILHILAEKNDVKSLKLLHEKVDELKPTIERHRFIRHLIRFI